MKLWFFSEKYAKLKKIVGHSRRFRECSVFSVTDTNNGNEAYTMDYRPDNPQGGPGGGYNPYNNNPYNNNPYNGNNPYNPYGAPLQPDPFKSRGDNMATASLILGVITLASLLLLRLSMPFLLGGVGIILAILSRGGARKMIGKAKAGMTCCIIGLVLDVTFCVFAVWLVFSLPKLSPDLTEEVNKMCEEQYGVSYYEMMEEIYDMWDFDEVE